MLPVAKCKEFIKSFTVYQLWKNCGQYLGLKKNIKNGLLTPDSLQTEYRENHACTSDSVRTHYIDEIYDNSKNNNWQMPIQYNENT